MMNKKIIRFLSLIITIVLVFFIGTNNVKANVDYCTWEMYQSYITTTDTGTYGVNAIDKSGDSNNVKFKWQLQYNPKWVNNFRIIQNDTNNVKKFSSTDFESILRNSVVCPKYVVLSAKGNNEEVDVAISEEFNNYYNTQYDGILKNNSTMEGTFAYYSYFISDVSKKSIVFIRQDFTKYPSKHLNETKKNAEDFNPSFFGISDCDTTCSLGIQEFYEVTKIKWFNVVNSLYSNIVCENGSCSIKNSNLLLRKAFSQWFTEDIARLVFEEDYEQFLKCYKLKLFVDDNISQEDFDNKVKAIETIIRIDDSNSDKDEINENPCESLCYYENNLVKEYCKKDELYNQCISSYDSCKNISSSSAYEQCMKSNMGEKNFENYNKTLSEVLSSINQDIDNYQEELNNILKRVDAPSIEGIEFEPYEAKCEDVVFFHIIYRIMTIAAPILVILFGSIDYAQAVFSSDEKKMQESKKKFPKRVALLIIFVAIPTIISIIMSFSGGETNLMKCVILGE